MRKSNLIGILILTLTTATLQQQLSIKDRKLRFLGGGGHGAHHEPTSKYNCPSNCLECEVKPPNKCTKCLLNWFVDKTDKDKHICKLCKVDRCNLCEETDKCKICRVGHQPDGKKCVETKAFLIMAYGLLAGSSFLGIAFFLCCCYFGFLVKDSHHHDAHGHHEHEDHHEDEHHDDHIDHELKGGDDVKEHDHHELEEKLEERL